MIRTITLFCSVRWFNLCDWIYNVFHYYGHLRFALQETLLFLAYFFVSPYRIARKLEGGDPYGETPHKTLQAIVEAAGVTSKDVVYDLGCGRGRSCFWLANVVGCKAVGIEYNPVFIKKAQSILKLLPASGLEFRLENMLKADLSDATVVYLYAISMLDSDVEKLAKKLQALPKKPLIITVSFSLNEYVPVFRIIKRLQVAFPWGQTTCYVQKVNRE